MDIAKFSESHETSPEIVQAIIKLIGTDADSAVQKEWEDGFRREEVAAIAFTLTNEDTLFWGVETLSRPA